MREHSRKLVVAVLLAIGPVGCGIIQIERTVFPAQATDSGGQLLFVEDIQDITQDTTLLPANMTSDLRDLGIQDENLINAVVQDGLGVTPPAPPPLPAPPNNTNTGTGGTTGTTGTGAGGGTSGGSGSTTTNNSGG